MSKLYKETKELMDVRRMMEKDDLPADAIKDTLEAVAGASFEPKAIAVFQAAEEVDLDVAVLDEMIKRLQGRKKALQTQQENMRKALLEAMLVTKVTQIKCPYFTISTKDTPAPLIIDDEAELPDEYVEVDTVIKPKKNEITKALRDGKKVSGAHLGKKGKTLQVRR